MAEAFKPRSLRDSWAGVRVQKWSGARLCDPKSQNGRTRGVGVTKGDRPEKPVKVVQAKPPIRRRAADLEWARVKAEGAMAMAKVLETWKGETK